MSSETSYLGTVFTAPSNETPATVTANVAGIKSLSVHFDVKEPSGINANIRSFDPFALGNVGAGMELNVWLLPLNVSFYRVKIKEPGAAATEVWGYFTDPQHPAPPHDWDHWADRWHDVAWNNYVQEPPNHFDHASSYDWNPPFGQDGGGYTWPISPIWSINGDDTKSHPLNGWTSQVMTLGSDGTMTVSKLLHQATRHTWEVYSH